MLIPGEITYLENIILDRLDRAIANNLSSINFPNAGVTHLPMTQSDHNPILIKLWQSTETNATPFHFESAWIRDPSCKNAIQNACHQSIGGSKQFRFSKKIKNIKSASKYWNKMVFKSCDAQIQAVIENIDLV